MAFVWADVVALAPELSTFPLALQPIYLRLADEAIDADQFCGADTAAYQLAFLNLVAHFATEEVKANANYAATGTVQSESVGGLSVTYGSFGAARAAVSNSRAGYETSPYGAAFLSLLRSSPCSGFAINVV